MSKPDARQAALDAYLAALGDELREGSPVERGKQVAAAFVIDTLGVAAESALAGMGRLVRGKAAALVRDVKERGIKTVARELNDQLDMQYQRGLERKRRKR